MDCVYIMWILRPENSFQKKMFLSGALSQQSVHVQLVSIRSVVLFLNL